MGNTSSIGERLRAERDRLGLSQEQMGEIGGVKVVAQSNYERGKRTPDAGYLQRLQEAGADAYYIMSGQRSGSYMNSTGGPIYASREEALGPVLELQKELGVVLEDHQLKVLLGFAAEYHADLDGVRTLWETHLQLK